jgi:hypothetical protein
MALQLLEIYKLLNKSNCGKCGLPTCLAFAQSAASGAKGAEDCPYLSGDAAEKVGRRADGADQSGGFAASGFATSIEALKDKVRSTDLKAAATRLGAEFKDGRLSVRILGREFLLDGSGVITSECHVNNWIQWLVLTYASTINPPAPEGRWIPFSELKSGATTVGYFSKRCEEPLRVIADEHTDVFFELLRIFGGKSVGGFDADYAVALLPLPNVPMLILYWREEDEFPSKLRVMFDPTADSYLGPEIITGMGRGIIEMLQKIIPKHEKGIFSLQYL